MTCYSLEKWPTDCVSSENGRNEGEQGLRRIRTCLTVVVVIVLTTGCRGPRQIRTADYSDVINQVVAYSATSQVPGAEFVPPPAPDLAGPHPVETYISYALSQNPDIDAARKEVDAAAYRVPQAASLRDPTFGVTVFTEPVQTAAGEQEVSLTASQQLPWFGNSGVELRLPRPTPAVLERGSPPWNSKSLNRLSKPITNSILSKKRFVSPTRIEDFCWTLCRSRRASTKRGRQASKMYSVLRSRWLTLTIN